MAIHHYSGTTGATISIDQVSDIYPAINEISLMADELEESMKNDPSLSDSMQVLSEALDRLADVFREHGIEIPD